MAKKNLKVKRTSRPVSSAESEHEECAGKIKALQLQVDGMSVKVEKIAGRYTVLGIRIDRIVEAIDKSKKVRGL